MTRASQALVELIRAEIDKHGPVSFAWFMEQALYHPEHGYYGSGQAEIGRHGDYFTNVSVGPLFGRLLAAQFAEIWQQLGKPGDFVIVEQGAHDGELARDVLQALKTRSRDLFDQVHYRIIEPFPVLQERQSHTVSTFQDKVEWCSSLETLGPFSGIQFSNELLDAMPVHLVCKTGALWSEKRVDWQDDKFVFTIQTIADPALGEAVKKLPALPSGYETDVNLAALEWIDHASEKLTRGVVLTIDYGHPREEFYAPDRVGGTLQCRASHRVVPSPFDEIGNCDITAHVEWTSIAERALARNLRVAGFTDQHHFLTGIISAWPELAEEADSKTRRALQTLLHPEMLGRSFQVIALAKKIAPAIKLSGFKFAREALMNLGL